MEHTRWKHFVGEGNVVSHRVEKGKGAIRDRSPGQVREIRGIRRRLDEFDLGEIFSSISEVMRSEMDSVVGKAPRAIQSTMKEGMGVLVKAVEETMCRISEKGVQEERERKEKDRRTEERMEKLEANLLEMGKKSRVGLSQMEDRVKDLEKRLEGGLEKAKEIEDQVGSVREDVEMVSSLTLGIKVGESVKEMEGKLREAMCALKVVNMDIGQETSNKAFIVRKVLGEVRRQARVEKAEQVDRVLRRTRVIVLGRKTESRKMGDRTLQTVPILLQCLDRNDVQVLEWELKRAGFLTTFHWPDEIMEFVSGVKNEVRKKGRREEGRWIRVRPEEEEGRVRIRVDTKTRVGGRFRVKGVWACPPLKRWHWEELKELYNPIWWEGDKGQHNIEKVS
jgi:hypothetical protein